MKEMRSPILTTLWLGMLVMCFSEVSAQTVQSQSRTPDDLVRAGLMLQRGGDCEKALEQYERHVDDLSWRYYPKARSKAEWET
jgi:hypothetical protein